MYAIYTHTIVFTSLHLFQFTSLYSGFFYGVLVPGAPSGSSLVSKRRHCSICNNACVWGTGPLTPYQLRPAHEAPDWIGWPADTQPPPTARQLWG